MKSAILFVLAILTSVAISCWSGKNVTGSADSFLDRLLTDETTIISDRVFDSAIDFSTIVKKKSMSLEIPGELQFINCTFKKEISWSSKTGQTLVFADDIVFRGCTFEEGFNLNDARFEGRVFIKNCVFFQSLDLQRSTFEQAVRIEENELGNDLVMQYVRVKDDLSLFGTKAGRDILMQGLSIFGKTQMGNMECNGALDMSKGDFHEGFSANYMKVGRKVLAGNSRFDGDFSMRDLMAPSVSLKRSRVMGGYTFGTIEESVKVNTEGLVTSQMTHQ